jgi:hypothetical protein
LHILTEGENPSRRASFEFPFSFELKRSTSKVIRWKMNFSACKRAKFMQENFLLFEGKKNVLADDKESLRKLTRDKQMAEQRERK